MLTALPETHQDPLAAFHPAVQQWFRSKFEGPSPPQARGWPAISAGRDTLIAAPTGSGKTLAAFLWCLDSLVRQALEGDLRDETQVLYLSPLKALSNDVQKNLAQPLQEIGAILEEMGLPVPDIRAVVRTGDTPSSQRQAMVKKPPHILVTTPESAYILLTSQRGRDMLKTVRTVIVDEIHAVAGTKRGTHLALSLERLEHLTSQTGHRPVRIGLSATQKPIEDIGKLLVGVQPNRLIPRTSYPVPQVIDEGYRRAMQLDIDLPGNPLEAVCSLDTWEQVYNRLADLVAAERTTLIFVNTRRLAERLTFHLAKRLGDDQVTSHHGSLSRQHRLKAEHRLKAGQLKALVATASLELGIDIGTVDLVCQIGTPRAISTLLQRVGRSGHNLGGTPRGKLFPLTRDELVECAAILHEVRRGNLDRIEVPEGGLDILAQQIVAMVAAEEWEEDDLFHLCRRAYPYRDLTREDFDAVCGILSEGFSNHTGRSAAYLHYDAVQRRFRARRGARLAAITSGGAIPDNADYTVLLEPENSMVGTVNEDWAVESLPGDIFQLGATSWRIIRVEPGIVRVEDAHGQPPTMPFWLGEAPGRSDEVSAAVSQLRAEVGKRLAPPARPPSHESFRGSVAPGGGAALAWLTEQTGISTDAAQQITDYIAAGQRALGTVPTQQTIVLERFFDESGGMQLVLHAPFGSRVNRAWGLALRKRFCRTFNVELQAAATEDAIVLSLGPQHSFPLEDVFSYLHPNSVQAVLIQAVLASPMFMTRWRWNLTRSLALLRFQGGRKTPMPLQRMKADDLLGAAFPDLAACQENVTGPFEIPDHPIVQQTVKDCLYEGMDANGLLRIVGKIINGEVELIARDTTEPSVFAHEILTARPYAFLDDAPLEERRTQAVYMRRNLDPATARDLGQLDPEAIQRVREQAWPEAETPDELHDALLALGYVTDHELRPWTALFETLVLARRATTILLPGPQRIHAATERVPMLKTVLANATEHPPVQVPDRYASQPWDPETALKEVLRGRLEALGPVTAEALARPLGLPESQLLLPLTALESEGFIFRGHYTSRAAAGNPSHESLFLSGAKDEGVLPPQTAPVALQGDTPGRLPEALEGTGGEAADPSRDREGVPHPQTAPVTLAVADSTPPGRLPGALEGPTEWCDRRLLARIHRYTLDRLRKEIEPVSAADFLRFLFVWQHVATDHRLEGATGLTGALESLQGFEVPVSAWEEQVLPMRIAHYNPTALEQVCLSGEVLWARLYPPVDPESRRAAIGRATPISLTFRDDLPFYEPGEIERAALSGAAREILEYLHQRGACFFQDLVAATRRLPSAVEEALRELAAGGAVTCDGWAGLLALVSPARRDALIHYHRERAHRDRWTTRPRPAAPGPGGRWALLWPGAMTASGTGSAGILPAGAAGTGAQDNRHRIGTTSTAPGSAGILPAREGGEGAPDPDERLEFHARQLLRRWGVIFPRLLTREQQPPPWRDLVRVYRRLEARGEVRGGRFVSGFSGEQYALPEAVQQLRSVRRAPASSVPMTVSGADPLNLVGILTPGPRVPAVPGNRVTYRAGVPVSINIAGRETSLDLATQGEAG